MCDKLPHLCAALGPSAVSSPAILWGAWKLSQPNTIPNLKASALEELTTATHGAVTATNNFALASGLILTLLGSGFIFHIGKKLTVGDDVKLKDDPLTIGGSAAIILVSFGTVTLTFMRR